ncbi:3'(2'),5'-bisphosphate nucleotidase [Lyngbya confervoides]|uniref:3'(2'),5'-bisphosphate nucleotidase n=1 Tax=Lyngbya confervoides BDU141951 TaxID=1574623 RepID=A0ABD4SYB0_9CYAN|nr:3'(2'),5'-bisphosphate nucleotidase [Lyngbya confervoides]MCM1981319.1 3'(2'),5'-bisphosphate nucleotidase [Lyngbya confervoides BDU141951]
MSYEREKIIAIEAVLAATQLCEQVRQQISPAAIEKKDKSPVTIADYGSQALICRALAEAFPQDPVIAEEEAAALGSAEMKLQLQQVTDSIRQVIPTVVPAEVLNWIGHGSAQSGDRYWTLDPIDGTKGFLRQDQYAVALALVEAGEIKVGVLSCPALSLNGLGPGLLFTAVRGEGATMRSLENEASQPIQVAQGTQNLRFVESVESGHGNQSQQSAIAQTVGITAPSLRMDSQAKYAAVATGEAALYLRLPSPKTPDYREKIWDHAAGVIVVEEAGGKVTDMYGQKLDFTQGAKLVHNQGVIVSNGRLHDQVIAALAT